MILAWLLLLTGLTISAVAIYYSVVGLAAIFSAAVIPIVIMGSALEVGKLVCASWLKANWERAPRFMKYYMITAVMVLMFITSMGIFGFLSKAHNDQNLVSGDVQSRIAIYDEKIKTARENIEASRKQLKQMDEAVDQVMARSKDERGANNANAIRRSQQRDRTALAKEIETNQKLIATLNEESAPIRAEIRKVEAEVGPIKYIAKFIYGDKGADENMLERAVTWIIILIVIVFDPLAVIMLLAAQMTFGWNNRNWLNSQNPEPQSTGYPKDNPWPFPEEEKHEPFYPMASDKWPFPKAEKIDSDTLVKEAPYHPGYEDVAVKDDAGMTDETQTKKVLSETQSTALGGDITAPEEPEVLSTTESELDKWNRMIAEAEAEVAKENIDSTVEERVAKGETYIDGEGNEVPASDDTKKKTYMTKDDQGHIQIKNREV